MSTQTRARKLTVTAMLSTIAFILMYIEFPIPALIPSFVKLDISDLPELLAAFSLGPVYGVVVSLLKNVLFSLLHGTSSAYVGETFNFIMGAVFSFSAGFIYKKYKSRKGALTGAGESNHTLGYLSLALYDTLIRYKFDSEDGRTFMSQISVPLVTVQLSISSPYSRSRLNF